MIAIVDYGAGNLKSVKKAFDFLGVANMVISSGEQLTRVEKVVLPGVGAFGAAVEKLQESGFDTILRTWLLADRPFLGICLGMQLLLESSSESPGVGGLSFLRGDNLRFNSGKVPQIGWNKIHIRRQSGLLAGIPDGSYFYFLHAYYIAPEDAEPVVATSAYGISYPSIIQKGNVCAVQFHPEKSSDLGLRLLKNWVDLC